MEKKFLIGMAVLLSASLFFLGCGGGDEEPGAPDLNTATGGELVFAAPVTGQEPDDAITATSEYTGSIAWKVGTDGFEGTVFERETAYTAVVTLTAVGNNTFAGVLSGAFKYAGATSVTSPAGTGTTLEVTVGFPKTGGTTDSPATVTEFALGGFFAAPATGVPAAGSFAGNHQYSGAVKWKADGEDYTKSAFEEATVYTAVVTLAVANATFTFDGVGENAFKYAGATATNQAGSGVVTIVFPTTPGTTDRKAKVDALNLDGSITAPVIGATPSPSFTFTAAHGQYTAGNVSWIDDDDTFKEATVYRAEVILTPAAVFTFDGAGSFTYGGVNVPRENAGDGKVKVTVTFDKTDTVVTALNLAGAIVAPVTGATPVLVFTSPDPVQYKGGPVTWSPPVDIAAEETFAAGTVYTAAVTLAPEKGYTFATLKEDAFGAGTKYTAATGILEVEFAATAAVVSDTNLTLLVVKPVKNAEPVSVFGAAQYDGEVSWTWDDNGKETPHAAKTLFAANRAYTATVTLTAKEGLFTFDGFEGAFSHSLGTPGATTPKDGKVEVTVVFGATAENETNVAYDSDPIRVTPDKGTLDSIKLTKTKTGTAPVMVALTVSSSTGAAPTNISWTLDGVTALIAKDGVSGDKRTLTLNPNNYNSRDHHVTVKATINGGIYSVTVPFTVEPVAE
jgi:hypothetical protein